MTSSEGGSKGLQQVNNYVKAEYRRRVNGLGGNGQGSEAGDELRTSKIDENGQEGCQVAVQGNAVARAPQQLAQGSLVHWEKFLHVRSIKVMLVEDDDCTRHIVTALLRNCNYEVIEATNGLQAWKILEDLSNHIDIVLTEVVMPFLSGIGLLCKIMSHKTRKNVPVIMMSSHDSMGLVFKCLSKGAVDFLVKPIRKNELKNLWQHVWRRCHSSSGSGSESGTHAQKSVNSKSNLRCYNNGREEEGEEEGEEEEEEEDDNESTDGGSDDGSGTQSSWTKQGVEPESPEASPCVQHPDSTCGLVLRPRRDFNDEELQPFLDDGANANETAKHISKNSEMQSEVPIKHIGIKQNVHQALDPILNVKSNDSKKHRVKDSKISDRHKENGFNIKGQEEPEKIINDSNEVVVGEPDLKRLHTTEYEGRKVQSNLRHSELSAFTRYNTDSNAVKYTPGVVGSCSQPDDIRTSSILKKESNNDAHSDGYLIYQGSSERVITDATTPTDVPHQELHIQHIHHHHHVHHYHNTATDEPLFSKHDDFGLSKLAADAQHCGSSNIKGGPIEVNLEDNSMNRSGSGSKHGSNVPNGSNTGANLEVTNVESNVGVAGKSETGHKSAQREAALAKFRQKREARCFEKKVRYQNRKKLAEQRPRVRGQFVKGTNRDSSTSADDG